MNPRVVRVRVKPFAGYIQNWGDSSSECFVSGAVAVVLRVSRFLGVVPLRFEKVKSGWRVSVSPALSYIGYVVVTLIILLTIGTLVYDTSMELEHSGNMRTPHVWLADFFLMIVIAGTVVYRAPGQMRGMIRYLNHLQKINHELNIDHWPVRHERNKIITFIVWVIFTVALTCIYYVTHTYAIPPKAETWVSVIYTSYYNLFYWIMLSQQMLFIVLTKHVLCTFEAINENLKNLYLRLCEQSPGRHQNSGTPELAHSNEHTVRYLGFAYKDTCDVVREVDRCHGLVLLMLLSSYIFHIVVMMYRLINDIYQFEKFQGQLSFTIKSMMQFFWCLYHACNLIMVIEPCHKTHAKMENIRVLIGHLTWYPQTPCGPLAVELQYFYNTLNLNEASYSPLKVTSMARALILSILASIIMYLAIVLDL